MYYENKSTDKLICTADSINLSDSKPIRFNKYDNSNIVFVSVN